MKNNNQEEARANLQEEQQARRQITDTLPDVGESEEGFFFSQVVGVTVIFGEDGGPQLPAVRTYPKKSAVYPGSGEGGEKTEMDALVYADREFEAQKRDPNGKGHFGAVVNTDWYCNVRACWCHQKEADYDERLRRSVTAA